MIDIDVTLSGPIFDGRAAKALDDFLTEAEDVVADEGVNRVRARLGQVLRNPTGAYSSRVTTDLQQDDRVVTDARSIKGPWLEGTSSRNRTTRFKGYRTFRAIGQDLQDDAARIAEREVLPKFLQRMNG